MFETYFERWRPIIEELKLNADSVALGWFDINGKYLAGNKVMDEYISNDKNTDAERFFINPSFEKLKKLNKGNLLVFEGFLTIGNYLKANYSVDAKIFYKEQIYFVFGKADIADLLDKVNKISDLNHEIASLQRQLIKEKVKLERVNTQLNEINIEKNKYIGIVAHDLRNPIGNAFEFSSFLLQDHEILLKKEGNEYLKIINEQCAYSLSLIENYLDVSKIEAGIIDLKMDDWNFCVLIEECIQNNILHSKRKNQTINFQRAKESINVYCDKDKIKQVINNLLSNALKFSNEHSTVQISVSQKGEFIQTSITDEGIGISKSELASVFDDFKLGSAKSTAGEKSTGLGLAIVKKIIESHKGSISVNSKLNKGSEFVFLIPIKNTHT